jgi:hypothetical protein
LQSLDASVITYHEDGAWPSDHFPVEAVFELE